MSDPTKTKVNLSQREVLDILFRDRAVRAYTFAALGALAMVFAVMFTAGSDVGGVVVVLCGSAALVLRWTSMPPFLVLIVVYFQLCPSGLPAFEGNPFAGGTLREVGQNVLNWLFGSENPFQVRETIFQASDVVLVLAVLVYLRAQYRILGFVHQVMPSDSAFRRKGEVPTRRPASHIRPDEIAWLVGIAGAVVLVGQGLWWLVNSLELTPLADSPLRWADQTSMARYRQNPGPGEFRPGQHRFFIILGGLFFGALLLRLMFNYWQWRMMSAAEGALVLSDTSWAESHRERVRVEKWRIWGRRRAEEQEKEAERAKRAAERKAERAREEREAKERERQKKADKSRARTAKKPWG